VAMTLAAISVLLAVAALSFAQSVGYSYLRIDVAGRHITNIMVNEKYAGWLQIGGVEARPDSPNARVSGPATPSDFWHALGKDGNRWTKLPAILHAGRADAGKLSFGVGDNGGLGPLIDAQKHKSVISAAELDLYDSESGAFIGKYRINGVRVLSLEDVQSSACPMYEITISFLSVEKI
jgi:hypothetical protein